MLEARGVGLDRDGRALLDGVSIVTAPAPVVTCVLGPNGAGKTLLLKVLAAIEAPSRGEVLWDGAPPGQNAWRERAFVFQRPVMLRRTVEGNIRHALSNLALATGEVRRRTERALSLAGLSALAHRPATVLSGGEQAKLALARALARQPRLLFLDEPTANLDPSATAAVEAIVADAAAQGLKAVLVTHDLGQARRLAGEIVFVDRGRVCEHAPAARFFSHAQSPEARAFLEGRLLT